MIIVKPETITDVNMVSDIPEPDASVGEIEWTAGTYSTGDRRVVSADHAVYEVVASGTTTANPTGGNSTDWVRVSSTNRFKMFDQKIGAKSTQDSQIQTSFTMGRVITSLSGFEVSGNAINITMSDPTYGEVYNRDLNLRDNSGVIDWFSYFFEPVSETDFFSVQDLPAYPSATITLTITGGTVSIGETVVGQQKIIGEAQYGSSWQLLDYSDLQTDEFGEVDIIRRRTADLFDFDISINKSDFGYAKKTFKSIAGVPCVFVGTDDIEDGTLVYGIVQDLQTNIDSPAKIFATARIQGLV